MSSKGEESDGALPRAFSNKPLSATRARERSSGAGLKKFHLLPSARVEKSSESGWPCGTARPPFGLGSGLDRSPPVILNQPSAVHSTRSSRVWRPSVQ